jgi:endoglucanase
MIIKSVVKLNLFKKITALFLSLATGVTLMLTSCLTAAEPLLVGIYDRHRIFSGSRGVAIEHIFLNWFPFRQEDYRAAAEYAAARNRQLMITLEPWTRAPNGIDGGKRLLPQVVAGEFDQLIRSICGEIGTLDAPVLVRWGHEMDDQRDRYPWANRRPENYIAAYRHFVDHCRRFAPKARFVWSPKGLNNMHEYYPGSSYVDYIGVILFGFQTWDIDYFSVDQSFDDSFAQHYNRVSAYDKPVIVAEVGVAGDDAYRKAWLTSMFVRKSRFPKLAAVIYFNAREPFPWPDHYGQPDWRISPRDLRDAGIQD